MKFRSVGKKYNFVPFSRIQYLTVWEDINLIGIERNVLPKLEVLNRVKVEGVCRSMREKEARHKSG